MPFFLGNILSIISNTISGISVRYDFKGLQLFIESGIIGEVNYLHWK